MASARISTRISAITIIFRLIRNPAQTSGRAWRKFAGEKKALMTLSTASSGSLLDDVQAGEVQVEPLLLQLRDRAVLGQGDDRGVDRRAQLAALLEDGAVVLVGDDRADDRA